MPERRAPLYRSTHVIELANAGDVTVTCVLQDYTPRKWFVNAQDCDSLAFNGEAAAMAAFRSLMETSDV